MKTFSLSGSLRNRTGAGLTGISFSNLFCFASLARFIVFTYQQVNDHFFRKMLRSVNPIAIVIVLLFLTSVVQAATKTWVPTAGGSWATAANWNPASVPGSTDDVVIGAQTQPITAIPAVTVNSLTINGSVTFAAATAGNVITVSTTFTVASGITLTLSTNRPGITLASTATGTINGIVASSTLIASVITNNGILIMAPTAVISGNFNTFTNAAGATLKVGSPAGITTSGATGNIQTSTRNYNAGATYEYNGSAAQVTGNGLTGAVNLTISNTVGTVTLSSNVALTGDLNIAAGAIFNLSTLNANRSASGGTLTVAGTLQLNNTTGGRTGSNFPNNFSTLSMTGGTVNYSVSGGGQTIFATPNYNNLTLSNTGGIQTITAGGTLTVSGTLTTTTGGTLNLGTNVMAGTPSTITNNGTIRTQNISSSTPLPSGLTWGGTGTVQYDAAGGGQTVVGGTYAGLNINNATGTNTASGAIIAFTINTVAGGTLNMDTYDLGLTNISNNGILRTQSVSETPIPSGKTWGGTVNYDAGSGAQRVRAGTYNNLTLSNGSGIQSADGNLTVNGTLTTTAGGTLNMVTHQLLGTLTTIANGGTINTQNSGATPIPLDKTWDGTISYNGSGSQTVVRSLSYFNLDLSGEGTKTLASATNIKNILIGTGVVANLGTGLEHSAITLKLGGILQDNGVYGSSDSPAIPPNNTYFSGTGVLNVSDVVGATKLVITGNSTQIAGGSQTITITAKDNFGNVDGSYDGDRVLTFSGASSSPAPSTTAPTITNKNGAAIAFGNNTTITFTNGVGTGSMRLYNVESASIAATDGTLPVTPAPNQLPVVVSSAGLDHFVLTLTSPHETGIAFGGTLANTLTALDLYDNRVANFDASGNQVTFSTSASDGVISGLGSGGNILNQAGNFDAITGVADLSGMIFAGTPGSYTITATSSTAPAKSVTSGSITINHTTGLNFYSIVGGNWNSSATWSYSSGGSAVPAGMYPIAGDAVFIQSGYIVSLTSNASCGAITMTNTATSGTSRSTVAVGANTLNASSISITGNSSSSNRTSGVTVSSGTINVTGNITFSGTTSRALLTFTGSGILNLGGNLGSGGTFAASTGTVNYNANGAQNIGPYTYNNLTLSGSGGKTFPNGTTTVNGILSMEGTATTTLTGTLTYGSSATLQYKGSSPQTTGAEFLSTFPASASAAGVIIDNPNGVTLGGGQNSQCSAHH